MMATVVRPRTLADLRDLLQARPAGSFDPARPLAGLCDDSRAARPGVAFFARRGSRADGRAFVRDALARGVSVVVCEGEQEADVPALLVPDARAALRRAADAWYGRPQDVLRLVGITGTKGKTTTAHVLQAALEACGLHAARLGTIAYDVGAGEPEPSHNTTPGALDLRRLLARARDADCRAAVLEVSSHALDQGRTDGLDFAAAVFTNLASDHLDYHGDPASYFEAKARLFEGLSVGGAAVLNREDAAWTRLAERVRGRVLTYGLAPEADLRAEDVRLSADGTRFRLVVAGEGQRDVSIPLVGRHNVLNVLAALGACLALGFDPMVAADGAARVARVSGRLERVAAEGDVEAFVDYAHTEDALRQVLVFLRTVGAVPLTCVVGCGGDRDRSKRPRMARVAVELADRVIFTSDNPRGEDPGAILSDMTSGLSPQERERVTVIPDRRAAIEQAVRGAPSGGTVLVAGKGHERTQIVGDRQLPFDDVAEVRRALGGRAGGPGGGSQGWGASPA
jgi:UDP-N-acetylmuramoyl-L-alanyl-D-glutamate--2,6-diaminopimelate ligase